MQCVCGVWVYDKSITYKISFHAQRGFSNPNTFSTGGAGASSVSPRLIDFSGAGAADMPCDVRSSSSRSISRSLRKASAFAFCSSFGANHFSGLLFVPWR